MFNEKLKKAMVELGISQSQLSRMTGVGKSSISQYLSGKNVPTAERQVEIAKALDLPEDYFTTDIPKAAATEDGVIPKLEVKVVAKMMGMNHNTLRKGLKQGIFPWGYAIHTSENHWVYFINANRFAEIEGVKL